ncbi:short-chain fatty acid transporter [Alkalihalobacillus sp. 1P02AB]|uniref:short-chain fatty acid transporter n=1 Tax=Alkalihalobacillus sp. 1P02AB TaxID=3132260 RepID=UPI0039A4D216
MIAFIFTIFVFVLSVTLTESTPVDIMVYWGDGFWNLLAFTMQMALIVITGYILANTPIIKSVLTRLALFAHTPGQAIILVTLVAMFACMINYGFGLVIGGLIAQHVVKVVPKVDYRILIASAYSGILVWHGGLSGSIPLTIATPGHFLEEQMGVIPISETLLSPYNIFIMLCLVITLPIVNYLILKSTDINHTIDPTILKSFHNHNEEAATTSVLERTPSEWIENSKLLPLLIGGVGLVFVIYYFFQNGLDLNINIVNFSFLFLGILLHKTPRRYLSVLSDATKNAGGIIIQFPFYAGIMAMIVGSGLSDKLAVWFISISTDFTFPLFTFLSAGLINVFVPSGGGQWAIQGPIVIQTAVELGVEPAKIAMAVAWGDAWTTVIQPFWALPLLAIAGLKVRDIMGFCIIILFWAVIPISIGMLFF